MVTGPMAKRSLVSGKFILFFIKIVHIIFVVEAPVDFCDKYLKINSNHAIEYVACIYSYNFFLLSLDPWQSRV